MNGYWRSGSNVSSHTRSVGSYNNSNNLNQGESPHNNSTTSAKPSTQHSDDNVGVKDAKKPRSNKGSARDYPTTREPRSNSTPTKAGEGTAPEECRDDQGSCYEQSP